MLTAIKQWFYQKLANHLLSGVVFQTLESKGYENGLILHGLDWDYTIPQKRIPKPVEKPYVPKYATRTDAEHAAIRKRIQVNPADCPHIKGGRIRWPHADYNVRTFTFIDGNTTIKCLSCRHEWTPKSHDWAGALWMAHNSTNTPNSSEVTMKIEVKKS